MNKLNAKKLDWLKTHGGENAVQVFSQVIKQMDEFAQATNLPSKENEQEEIVGNLLVDEEFVAGDASVSTSTEVVIEKDADEVVAEIVVDVVETETVPEVTSESVDEVVVETVKEFVTTEDFNSAIDEIVKSAIMPLANSLAEQIQLTKNLSAELVSVRKELENVTELYKSVTEVDKVLDVIPAAAAITHIQTRLTDAMKQFSNVSLAEDDLVERKPAENIYANEVDNNFDLFLSGK